MDEQMESPESSTGAPATQRRAQPDGQQPTDRAVCDPRDVPALVMRRISVVNGKKNELDLTIGRLVDITRQLTRTYGAQVLVAEQLRSRVRSLEAAVAAAHPAPGDPECGK